MSAAAPVAIAAAYRFVDLHDCVGLREWLWTRAQEAGLKGTLLVTGHGIHFTLAGGSAALQHGLDSGRCFVVVERVVLDERLQGVDA